MSQRTRRNYRNWYERHREEYLAQRRERLRTDPEFAARRRETAYRYFDKSRDAINTTRRHRMKADPVFAASKKAYDADYWEKLKAGHQPQPRPLHGESGRVYRQSEAARLAGCSAAGIIKWTRHGWLPEPHRENGRRLFTREQVDLIAHFKSINPHDFFARTEASKFIFESW